MLTELTEDEREMLGDVWDEETTVSVAAFFPVVARMIAAREATWRAPIEAIAAEWQRLGDEREGVFDDLLDARESAAALRAALGSVSAPGNEAGQ